jgi:hypothetical protein
MSARHPLQNYEYQQPAAATDPGLGVADAALRRLVRMLARQALQRCLAQGADEDSGDSSWRKNGQPLLTEPEPT